MPRPQFNKRKYEKTNTSKYQSEADVGKLSLWLVPDDYKSQTCVATGVLDLLDEEGNVVKTHRVFLHRFASNNPKSPDFTGFIKVKQNDQNLYRDPYDEGMPATPQGSNPF